MYSQPNGILLVLRFQPTDISVSDRQLSKATFESNNRRTCSTSSQKQTDTYNSLLGKNPSGLKEQAIPYGRLPDWRSPQMPNNWVDHWGWQSVRCCVLQTIENATVSANGTRWGLVVRPVRGWGWPDNWLYNLKTVAWWRFRFSNFFTFLTASD